MANITLHHVSKRFSSAAAVVDNVSIEVPDGSFCVLLGPSGCGKSTLLRMIAGLESASGGDISIGSVRVNDLSPKDRDIAMVFQNYALYPHLSVVDNIAFPLEARGVGKRERREQAAKIAASVQLDGLLDRKPSQLSGGQRQRVALARAIIRQPKAFLFDEPLSNLDAKMRQVMRVELRGLHKRLGITSVYVTHDQEEALALADQIVVLAAGKVRQVGSPTEIFHAPADKFVAGFVGVPSMNFFSCAVEATGTACTIAGRRVELPVTWATALKDYVKLNGSTAMLGVRPSSLTLCEQGHSAIAMRVTNTELLGDVIDIHGDTANDASGKGPSSVSHSAGEVSASDVVARLPSNVSRASNAKAGQLLAFAIDFSGAHVFGAGAEGKRICGGADHDATRASGLPVRGEQVREGATVGDFAM